MRQQKVVETAIMCLTHVCGGGGALRVRGVQFGVVVAYQSHTTQLIHYRDINFIKQSGDIIFFLHRRYVNCAMMSETGLGRKILLQFCNETSNWFWQ